MSKTEAWYLAMAKRKGNGTNQFTKAKKLGLDKPVVSENTRKKLSIVATGRIHSEDTKKRMSETHKKNGLSGGIRPHKSGFGIKGYYDNIFFDSSWELAYYLYCKNNNSNIIRNTDKFRYEYNGVSHNYTPDFIVDGVYVEIKGYENDQMRAKYLSVPSLIVLHKKEMMPIIELVKKVFGENFVELFKTDVTENLKNVRLKHLSELVEAKELGKLDKNGNISFKKLGVMDISYRINLVLSSNIDFSKFGWVSRVSEILNLSHSQVRRFMIENMESFYKEKCFHRSLPV